MSVQILPDYRPVRWDLLGLQISWPSWTSSQIHSIFIRYIIHWNKKAYYCGKIMRPLKTKRSLPWLSCSKYFDPRLSTALGMGAWAKGVIISQRGKPVALPRGNTMSINSPNELLQHWDTSTRSSLQKNGIPYLPVWKKVLGLHSPQTCENIMENVTDTYPTTSTVYTG